MGKKTSDEFIGSITEKMEKAASKAMDNITEHPLKSMAVILASVYVIKKVLGK